MIEFILLIPIVFTLLPVIVLFIQVLYALRSIKLTPLANQRLPVVILIPAHNEELVIAETLRSLISQLNSDDRLLVIADNCTDQTAIIAKTFGVEIIERQNNLLRGKGYALAAGLAHLIDNPRPIVIIIDADCKVHPNCIQYLAQSCEQSNRPVQALDLMQAPPAAKLKLRIAEFAWLLKNYVRPLGYLHLNFPCPLMGTGMAFPWAIISDVQLNHGHLVEDLKLTIDLAAKSIFPLFCPQALVTSFFPTQMSTIDNQRSRWEHGHLMVIKDQLPILIRAAITKRSLKIAAIALDLMLPPLALLVLMIIVSLLLSFTMLQFNNHLWIFLISIVISFIFLFTILLAWVKFARQIVSLTDLFYIPIYILWKIPLYFRFFINKQQQWIKTKRE